MLCLKKANLVHYCIERYLALALVYLGVVAVVLPWCLPLNSSRLGELLPYPQTIYYPGKACLDFKEDKKSKYDYIGETFGCVICRELRTEEASRQKLEQRMAGLAAMLAVVLVGSSGHSRGGLIRKKEAIRGRMDEQPQESVMALVGQWRPTAGRPPRWPPPDEDNASRGAMTQPRGMWRPEAWLAAVQGRELCQTSFFFSFSL